MNTNPFEELHPIATHTPEGALTRSNMPPLVYEELIHQENLHPEFHPFKYSKSCTTPEDCVYVISGTNIPDGETSAKPATLTITYKQSGNPPRFTTDSTLSYQESQAPDHHEKIAA